MKHIPIVLYFYEYGFGTNMPVLTYLSYLTPFDRCIILEKLFSLDVRNIQLYDKMALAYVKVGKPEFGREVVAWARKMGESEFDCQGIEQKLNLGIPQTITDQTRLAILEQYLFSTTDQREKEFLKILIDFIQT